MYISPGTCTPLASRSEHNYFSEMCSGTEEGSYLRLGPCTVPPGSYVRLRQCTVSPGTCSSSASHSEFETLLPHEVIQATARPFKLYNPF